MERKAPLLVAFALAPQFLGATMRQYDFMLKGLACVEDDLARSAIPFYLLEGQPEKEIPDFSMMVNASALVSDFDPLRIKREWKAKLITRLHIPFYEVDAHNIVPCWMASSKQEYGAYTLRPKLKRLLPDFLTDYPALERHPYRMKRMDERIDWQKVRTHLKMDHSVGIVDSVESGEAAAANVLGHFIAKKLNDYNLNRNDPVPGRPIESIALFAFWSARGPKSGLGGHKSPGRTRNQKMPFWKNSSYGASSPTIFAFTMRRMTALRDFRTGLRSHSTSTAAINGNIPIPFHSLKRLSPTILSGMRHRWKWSAKARCTGI